MNYYMTEENNLNSEISNAPKKRGRKPKNVVTNSEEVKHIDCNDVKLPYFRNLIDDVLNRSETACPQDLTYLTMELAIKAQEIAEKK